MDAAKSASASFVPPKTVTVSRSGAGSGTVTSSPAGIDCGSDCTEGYPQGTNISPSLFLRNVSFS